MSIKKIIVIFKTHLDIGFTDFSEKVVKKYMDEFIPNSLSVAKQLRESNSDARLVWTTGSWLIHEYLRTHTGNEKEILIQGIKNGDIRWHGLPFTTHTELMSSKLFEYGLSISQSLDKQFERKTIAAKMTDVPGHTRAIIPYLRKAGIEFLHIGVNPASTVPEVPPIFRWKAKNGELLNVMYQMDYGEFSPIGDSGTAVYFAHTGDNIGVQSVEDIMQIFADLKKKMPHAEIVAGDLNDLALAVREIEDTLPVVTDEIGDSWIHGVGTDPKKVSQFRALERLYENLTDKKDKDALARGLIMIPEHTWGMDVKLHLADHNHYDKSSFEHVRKVKENYFNMEASWREQRNYLYNAIKEMSEVGQQEALQCIAEASRDEAPTTDMKEYQIGEYITIDDYKMRFNEKGELDSLCKGDFIIADEEHRLLNIRYEQFSGADYKRFFGQYNRLNEEWAREDFMKIGMEDVASERYLFEPIDAKIYYDNRHIVVQYQFDSFAYEKCGCPKKKDIIIKLCDGNLSFDIAWFKKPANRIAEAVWVGFHPIAKNKKISKLSALIDPGKVVSKGQCRLHATDYGVVYDELSIETIDTALVAPQEPSLLNFCDDKPQDSKVYFNLYNNIWGTNFPMGYEEDARFRLVIKVHECQRG